MMKMNLNALNEHVVKILIAARPLDSVSAISKRIGLSYGWTHYWVAELLKAGVFERKGRMLALKEKNHFYRAIVSFAKRVLRNNVSLHYQVLELFGLKFAFTEIDGVFVWTKGGYNIERWREHYPIFIKTRTSDEKLWVYYTKKLGLNAKKDSKGTGVFLVLRQEDDFPIEFVEGNPAVPLREAVQFMKKYPYNFQPALEMVDEMYGIGLKIKYREARTFA
ncbi:TPA: hypothetical protein HA244_03880 [Candidatus Micrarchaeota archaeon]|nr:hypothetical protein [Candidatus Micrarchaeota archaeon]